MIGVEKELIWDNDNLIEFGVKASVEYLEVLKENGKEVPCLSESKYTLSEKCNRCIFLREKIIIDPAEVYVSPYDLGDDALYLNPEVHAKEFGKDEPVKNVSKFVYCPVSGTGQPAESFERVLQEAVIGDERRSLFGKMEREDDVYEIIKENPGIGVTDIELKTQLTYPGVYRCLRSLEIKNKIEGKWEEKNKKSYWPIEEKNIHISKT